VEISVLVVVILFVSVLISTVSGFGSSLIAMPLLTTIIGVREAAPLVVLIVLIQNTFMVVKYRRAFQLKDMALLCVGALAGIPFGVFALTRLNDKAILSALGVVLVIYALYDLFGKTFPVISRGWAPTFGFAGGGLAGAYNTYGPPILIYGNCRNWSPEALKGNVQLFGLLNSVLVISLHVSSGHYTGDVMNMFWISLPAVAIASLTGFAFDKYMNRTVFRKIVCVLLLAAGMKLIIF